MKKTKLIIIIVSLIIIGIVTLIFFVNISGKQSVSYIVQRVEFKEQTENAFKTSFRSQIKNIDIWFDNNKMIMDFTFQDGEPEVKIELLATAMRYLNIFKEANNINSIINNLM